MKTRVQWIAADWGTTHLRTYGLSECNKLLLEAQSADGMRRLQKDDFETALLTLIDPWLDDASLTTVLACGMVGAKQGWLEAPYINTPCDPSIEASPVEVATTDKRIRVLILPGCSQLSPADVMRGEETQLAGLLQELRLINVNVCMPGTHTKWVSVEQSKVQRFMTAMTGEVFGLMSQHSILRHGVAEEDRENTGAFLLGVNQAIANPANILSHCFGLRAKGLLHNLDTHAARAELSGLLIGTEIVGAKDYWQGQTIHLVGESHLNRYYALALSQAGVETIQHDPKTLTLSGLCRAYSSLAKTPEASI